MPKLRVMVKSLHFLSCMVYESPKDKLPVVFLSALSDYSCTCIPKLYKYPLKIVLNNFQIKTTHSAKSFCHKGMAIHNVNFSPSLCSSSVDISC